MASTLTASPSQSLLRAEAEDITGAGAYRLLPAQHEAPWRGERMTRNDERDR